MRRLLTILISGLLLLGEGVEAQAQMHAYGLAAKVNASEISNETLERNFQEYLREENVNLAAIRNPERVKQMRRQVLDILIDQELAWQAAQKAQLMATEDEVAEVLSQMRSRFKSEQAFVSKLRIEGYTEDSYREHLRHLVSARKYLDHVAASVPEVSDAEIHAFYTGNPDKFQMPEQVHVRHILVKLSPRADAEAQRAAREKIAGIRQQVQAGGDFAELARTHSEDNTAAQGGDLGFIPRGRTVKPFEDAAFALDTGDVSEVVKTRFGLHLIKLEERRQPELASEAMAREQIRAYLQSVKARQAMHTELQNLRSRATIEVFLPL